MEHRGGSQWLSWEGTYAFQGFRFEPASRRLFADQYKPQVLGENVAKLLEILLAQCGRSGQAGLRFEELAAEIHPDQPWDGSASRVGAIRNLMERIKVALGGKDALLGGVRMGEALRSWSSNGIYRMKFLPCSEITKDPPPDPDDKRRGEVTSANVVQQLVRAGILRPELTTAVRAAGNAAVVMGDERDTPGVVSSILIVFAEESSEASVPNNNGNKALALRAELLSEAEIAERLGLTEEQVRAVIREAIEVRIKKGRSSAA